MLKIGYCILEQGNLNLVWSIEKQF